jgi:hypothetical protein
MLSRSKDGRREGDHGPDLEAHWQSARRAGGALECGQAVFQPVNATLTTCFSKKFNLEIQITLNFFPILYSLYRIKGWGKFLKIKRKSLFNFSSYSHPEIWEFQGVTPPDHPSLSQDLTMKLSS